MKFSLDLSLITTKIHTVLKADSTLIGLLGTGNRIYVQRAPKSPEVPFIVIDTPLLSPNSIQEYSGIIRIFSYTKLLEDLKIDPNGDQILVRCEELLNNYGFTEGDLTVQSMFSNGIIPSFYDDDENNGSARGALSLSISAGRSD